MAAVTYVPERRGKSVAGNSTRTAAVTQGSIVISQAGVLLIQWDDV